MAKTRSSKALAALTPESLAAALSHPIEAPPSLTSHLANLFTETLSGKADEPPPEIQEVRRLAKLARDTGNPFPFIAKQWPELVVPEHHRDYPIFRDMATPADVLERIGRHSERLARVVASPFPQAEVLRIDWWQKIIIAAYFDDAIGEIFVKGCTGPGKGAAVGLATVCYFECFDDARIVLTSRAFDHAKENIYGAEVATWRRNMQHPGGGEVRATGIGDTERHNIAVMNPDKATGGEAFSGRHGGHTLYDYDEASAVPDVFYENAQKNASKIVALANPRTLSGWFRRGFDKLPSRDSIDVCYGAIGLRLCVTVGGLDCANVKHHRLKKPVSPRDGITISGEFYRAGKPIAKEHYELVQPLIPGQVDLAQFLNNSAKADKRLVDIFAHGKFPDEDPEKQVIMGSWLARHEDAWVACGGESGEYDPVKKTGIEVTCFGLDVARSLDGDSSVLTCGSDLGCKRIYKRQFGDVIEVSEWVLETVFRDFGVDLRLGQHPIAVDMDGIGAGVGDYLRKLNVWVIEFRGNATSQVDPRRYGNLRAESYATLGIRLDPAFAGLWDGRAWPLPVDEHLREELPAPEKIYQGGDALRFLITPKRPNPSKPEIESVKDKIGRSPDTADGVVYLWHAVRAFYMLDWKIAGILAGELVVSPGVEGASERELAAAGLAGKREVVEGKAKETASEKDSLSPASKPALPGSPVTLPAVNPKTSAAGLLDFLRATSAAQAEENQAVAGRDFVRELKRPGELPPSRLRTFNERVNQAFGDD